MLKSYSKEHHKMDTCKGRKSGVNLEDHDCRIIGDAEILKEYKEAEKASNN